MRAMMDTSVFLCRLGEKPDDPDAPQCVDFCNRMVKEGRHLFVAAPTVTEVTRYNGVAPPRTPGIWVAPFDERAAVLLGERMPEKELKHWKSGADGRSLKHIKYDALIIGCALRIPGCVFVSMDDGQLKLAAHCGLPAHHPREYYIDPVTTKSLPDQSSLFS